MNLNLPLSLYYETCDEEGMVNPYFTGDIIDSEGRTICRADSEGKALDLIGGFDDLLANIEALRAQLADSERRRVELGETVRPVAKWWNSSPDGIPMRLGATEVMGLVTRKEAEWFDALAALVGEK